MKADKLSALMMGCFTAVSYALKGFDHYSEGGLTVGEWGGSILLALAFGGGLDVDGVPDLPMAQKEGLQPGGGRRRLTLQRACGGRSRSIVQTAQGRTGRSEYLAVTTNLASAVPASSEATPAATGCPVHWVADLATSEPTEAPCRP